MVSDRQTTGDAGHADEATLDRYRSSELMDEERARVSAHLEACTACRERLASLTAFAEAVSRGYAEAAGQERDWARQRAIIADRTWARRPGRARARAARFWRFAPQAAVATIAVLVVGVLVREGVRGPADAERAVEEAFRPTRAVQEAATGDDAAGGVRPADRENASEIVTPGVAPAAVDRPVLEADPGEQDVTMPRDAIADRAGRQVEAPFADAVTAAAPPAVEKADLQMKRERRVDADAAPRKSRLEVAALEAEMATDDPLERFVSMAREALDSRDSVAVRGALSFWRDSLGLSPADADAAMTALVDSLQALGP